jgi:hypothetical protein
VERQQLHWVALATVLIAMLAVVNLAALALGAYALAPLVGGLNPPILSAGIGAAILRYRLYDLDRIISRTLAYGLLTVLLGGSYALVDLPLDPAAGRLEYRRHDAVGIIEGFSSRLRRQVDLDTLSSELLAVVDQTMQPTRTSLWLRPREVQSQPRVVAARRTVAATSGSPSTRWGTESGSRRLPSR